MKKRKKHIYPKQRKKRDTQYSNTWKVINKYGLDHIRAMWQQKGINRTGTELGVSPWVIRYISTREGWKRSAEHVPAIKKAVISGKIKPEYFKSLDFSGVELNTNKKDKNRNENAIK